MSLFSHVATLPISLLHNWGYLILLLTALFESSPLFGLFIPGQIITIFAGFLARIHVLNLPLVLAIATIGAILGDLFGYMLGKKYGYNFIIKYGKLFFFKKEYYEKIKKLMHNHTGKTLIIGRFNSLTRAFASFVAGATDVQFSKFMFFNVLGGIAWAFSFVFLGYIFGESYKVAAHYVGRYFLLAIFISLMLIYSYRFISKYKPIFTRYYSHTLAMCIIALYVFSKMIDDIIHHDIITKLDLLIKNKIVVLWHPLWTKIMIFITNIVSTLDLVILSIILLSIFIYQKRRYNALLLLTSLCSAIVTENITKNIVHRIRPDHALIQATGFSFPSGHATAAIIFFSLLLYSFKDQIKNKTARKCFIAANSSIFILIGFSRIYLGVHWLSDVIGGYALGLFWLTLWILILRLVFPKSTPIV